MYTGIHSKFFLFPGKLFSFFVLNWLHKDAENPKTKIHTYFQPNPHPASAETIKLQRTSTQQHQGHAVEEACYFADPLWPEYCAWICLQGLSMPVKICHSLVQLRSAAKLSARPAALPRRQTRVVVHPNTPGNISPRAEF